MAHCFRLPLGEQEELRQSVRDVWNSTAPPGGCFPTFFLCDPLQCQQPTAKRPGNGSGPRLALARDTMRGPGQRACHKSKPVHLHSLSLSAVALGSPSHLVPNTAEEEATAALSGRLPGGAGDAVPRSRRNAQRGRGEPGGEVGNPDLDYGVARRQPGRPSSKPPHDTAAGKAQPLSRRATLAHSLFGPRQSHHRNGAPERPGE